MIVIIKQQQLTLITFRNQIVDAVTLALFPHIMPILFHINLFYRSTLLMYCNYLLFDMFDLFSCLPLDKFSLCK